jgi:hypothetical protein
MYKFFFRFTVTTLTILTANLLTNAISDYMVSYKNHYRPLTFTLACMLIIVVVFYPLFIKLESWVESFSKRMVKSGKSMAGKYLGLLLSFLLGIIILAYFYGRVWYHIDFIKILFQGNFGTLI